MGRPLANKVLLIGWDAADWKVISPLLDAGKLPALEGLVNGGVMASLATLHPVLSPMLWTSIATGKRPFKHGVLGFTEPAPDGSGVRPVTSLSRKVKAVWNILNQTGCRCHVLGWWPSHPAEPLNGVMVSDHYHSAVGPLDKPWPLLPGSIHPKRLEQTLADLRFHPNELAAEQILPLIPRAAEIDQEKDPRLAMVAKTLAECTSIHAAATWLMEHEPWDFMAVYYDGIDHFCHGFMKYHPPRQDFIPERDYELYKGVVEAGYRFHDLMLRTLIELAGEGTTVILVSDHGFHPDHLRPSRIPREPAGPAVEHRDFGIFAMQGQGIKKDEYAHGASLLDIAPTILTLFGLPVGEDMDGRPLMEAFEQRPAIATIPSWEAVAGDDGRHPPDAQLDPVASQEAINQLVALGYIEKPDENRERAIANTVRELRYNLARSYMDADHHAQAVPILQELYELDPGEYRFGIQLAMCYRALERIGDLRPLVEELTARRQTEAEAARERLKELAEEFKRRKQEREEVGQKEPEPPADGEGGRAKAEGLLSDAERLEVLRLRAAASVSLYDLEYLRGFVNAAEGHHETALEHLAQAEQAEPERPGLHIQIGEAYLKLKRWAEAERAFAKAAQIDGDNPHAHLGLSRAYLLRGRNARAAAEALAAIGLLYRYPMAHFCLGEALRRLGRIPRAVEAFRVAIALNPNFAEAHERLAWIYERRLKDEEGAAQHRRLAEEIRKGRMPVAAPQEPSTPQPLALSPLPSPIEGKRTGREGEGTGGKQQGEGVEQQNVITVVAGLPRSGTSMMMKMLADGGMPVLSDGVREADPDNPRGYFEYEATKRLRQDREWLGAAVGKAVKIVAQLLPHLPGDFAYWVIFIERDLREVLASQRTMLERRGRKGANLSAEQLMGAFDSQVRRVKHWLGRQPNVQTLFVRYADVLADPAAASAAVNEFLGGRLDAGAMAAAVDSKLYRQRHSAAGPMRAASASEVRVDV